jgi:hypothetical protein
MRQNRTNKNMAEEKFIVRDFRKAVIFSRNKVKQVYMEESIIYQIQKLYQDLKRLCYTKFVISRDLQTNTEISHDN